MSSATLGDARKPVPLWVRRRFVAKHSGLSHAMMIAIPGSALLWAAVIHALHLI